MDTPHFQNDGEQFLTDPGLVLGNATCELKRFIYSRVRDSSAAEDLCQDVLMRAYVSRHKFDPSKASLKTWLIGIAMNCISEHHRRRRRTYSDPFNIETLAAHSRDSATAESALSDREYSDALNGAISAMLADSDKELLRLRYVKNHTYAEIAAQLEQTEAAIHGRLFRLRRYELPQAIDTWLSSNSLETLLHRVDDPHHLGLALGQLISRNFTITKTCVNVIDRACDKLFCAIASPLGSHGYFIVLLDSKDAKPAAINRFAHEYAKKKYTLSKIASRSFFDNFRCIEHLDSGLKRARKAIADRKVERTQFVGMTRAWLGGDYDFLIIPANEKRSVLLIRRLSEAL